MDELLEILLGGIRALLLVIYLVVTFWGIVFLLAVLRGLLP